MTYKTQGIVLSRQEFAEADKIIVIYSREYGKIRALAKGIRKIKSRLGGRLEPFICNNFLIAKGRSFDLVIGAEVIEDFRAIRVSLNKLSQAYLLAELIDKVTVEHEPQNEVYELLSAGLKYLNDRPSNDLLTIYFSLSLLSMIGFQPELEICLQCHQKILAGQNFFSFQEGGVVCGACYEHKHRGQLISDYNIKIIRLLLHHKLGVIDKFKNLKSTEINTLKKLTSSFVETVIEKELISRKIIDQIEGGQKGKYGTKA